MPIYPSCLAILRHGTDYNPGKPGVLMLDKKRCPSPAHEQLVVWRWGCMAEKQEPSDSILVLMAVVKPGSCVTCVIAAHGSGHLLGNSTLSWYSV